MIDRLRRGPWWWLVVAAITIVGLGARLWNLDFDDRQHLHPDERHWALTSAGLDATPPPAAHGTIVGPVLDWLDGDRSAANPYRAVDSFAYGPVTLAVAKSTASWLHDGAVNGDQPAAAVVSTLHWLGVPLLDGDDHPRFDAGYQVDLIGRLIGATADALTIVVIAVIARRIAGRAAGLAAAGLYACSVMAIQHAHFFGAEPVLALTSALVVVAWIDLDRGADVRRAVIGGSRLGVAIGAAMAIKVTAIGLVGVAALSVAAVAALHRRRADVVRVAALAIGAAIAFRVLNPAAFNGLGMRPAQRWLDDVRNVVDLSTTDWPPTVQWARRIPVLAPLRWMVVHTVGPAASLAAVVGAVAVLRRRSTLGSWRVVALAAAVVAPFAVAAASNIATARYFVPMMPGLHVLGGIGAAAGWRTLAQRSLAWRRVGRVAIASALAVAAMWAVAFVGGVYGGEHTRLRASSWIAENVPAGSTISAEAWDDALPLPIDGVDIFDYEIVQLDLFAPDAPRKVDALAEQVAGLDYVIESSDRVWASVVRIPARYPSTIRFFDGLDDGSLGFQRVATFRSPARLGPWRFDDSAAEESFRVYDHPEVRIWQRVRDVDVRATAVVLQPWRASEARPVHPAHADSNGLMLLPSEILDNERAGTYNNDFAVGSSPLLQIIGWVLVMQLITLVGFVISAPALTRLPDAGWGIAPVIGLGVITATVFVMVTVIGAPFSRTLIAIVVAAWVAVAATVAWRRRQRLGAMVRERWRVLLAAQVCAWLVFAIVLASRAANPDLWHPFRAGEKPFELSVLTSVLRSRTLPPYDPWLAGGAMNYYYGGYLLLATPARLLRTAPELVMSLGLALFASMGAGAAFSLGAAATAAGRVRAMVEGSRRVILSGVGAVFAVVVLASSSIVPDIVNRLTGAESGPFDWWGLSRVIPGSPAVTEFPAWSLLFGDLHAHVMDVPVVLTIGALCLCWSEQLRRGSWRALIGVAALVGLLAGLVRITNTWDAPLGAGAIVLTAMVARLFGAQIRRAVVGLGIAAAVGLGVWAPYAWRGEVFDAGLEGVVERTPLSSWLAQFGVFVAVSLLVVARSALSGTARSALSGTARSALSGTARSASVRSSWRVVIVGVAFVLVGVARPSLAVMLVSWGLFAACAWAGVHRHRRRDTPAALGAFGLSLGWAIIAAVEMVSVRNDLQRMNTVFKSWFAAWLILAVAAAVSLTAAGFDRRRWVRRGVGGVVAASLLITTAFIVLAVPERVRDGVSDASPTLDGSAFFNGGLTVGDPGVAIADDEALIEWLRANVAGIVTIAEAPGDDYTWTSRFAAFTGLPTPIGWPYHQSQQRREQLDLIHQRGERMSTLYGSVDGDEISDILRIHDIRYVVVGSTELTISTEASRAALRSADCVRVVFERGDSFIAEVDQPCLSRQWARG